MKPRETAEARAWLGKAEGDLRMVGFALTAEDTPLELLAWVRAALDE